MLAKSHIGVEEYLDLVFEDRPEQDYVDGEVVERALPDVAHSRLKTSLVISFGRLASRAKLMTGLRVQIEPRLFRIVDFAIYLGASLEGRYADRPAFAMAEIVAPDDSFTSVMMRVEDYRRWGVRHIWVMDPQVKPCMNTPKPACSNSPLCASRNSISKCPRKRVSRIFKARSPRFRFYFFFLSRHLRAAWRAINTLEAVRLPWVMAEAHGPRLAITVAVPCAIYCTRIKSPSQRA